MIWYRLLHGPQDGARVAEVGGQIPDTIYVGPKWLGDGYAAYGQERSGRFPCRYDREGDKFRFRPPAESPAATNPPAAGKE